jgi:predicted transposase YdaD
MDAVFQLYFVALDNTRHLRLVAAPFRKNKVMHRRLNVDTFLMLAARGRRARTCMQIHILYFTP